LGWGKGGGCTKYLVKNIWAQIVSTILAKIVVVFISQTDKNHSESETMTTSADEHLFFQTFPKVMPISENFQSNF